jgi:hypothetical protein
MENYISFEETLTDIWKTKVITYLNECWFFGWEYFIFWNFIIKHWFNYMIWNKINKDLINNIKREDNINLYKEYSELLDIVLSKNKWYFYIFECNWIYKIWITWDIKTRYKKYTTENPFETKIYKVWELYWNQEIETYLKRKFILKQFKWEWFRFNKDDLLYIEDLLDWISLDIVLCEYFEDELDMKCSYIKTEKNKKEEEEIKLYLNTKIYGHK